MRLIFLIQKLILVTFLVSTNVCRGGAGIASFSVIDCVVTDGLAVFLFVFALGEHFGVEFFSQALLLCCSMVVP